MSTHYVGEGYKEDAEKLIKDFVLRVGEECPDYDIFSNLWKECNFSAIYLGHPSSKELLEFTREIFRISADMLANSSFVFQVGALYLLYSLYRSQPVKPIIRIRITMDLWAHLMKIRDVAVSKRYKVVLFVIKYLIQNGIDFVSETTLMGPRISNLHRTSRKKDYLAEHLDEVESRVAKSSENQNSMQNTLKSLLSIKMEYLDLMSNQKYHEPYDVTSAAEYEEVIKMAPSMNESCNKASTRGSHNQDYNIGHRRSKIKADAFSKSISYFPEIDSDDDDPDDPMMEKVNYNAYKPLGKKKAVRAKKNLGRPRKKPEIEASEEEEKSDVMPLEFFENSLTVSSPKLLRGQKSEKLVKDKKYYDQSPSTYNDQSPSTYNDQSPSTSQT